MTAEAWSAIAAIASLMVAAITLFWERHRARTEGAISAMQRLMIHTYPSNQSNNDDLFLLVNELLAIAKLVEGKLVSGSLIHELIGWNIISYLDHIEQLTTIQVSPTQTCSGKELMSNPDFVSLPRLKTAMQQFHNNAGRQVVP